MCSSAEVLVNGADQANIKGIELVGTVFASAALKEGENNMGKVCIRALGNPCNPVYESSWCLIDWQTDDEFTMTTSRGDKLKNGATPLNRTRKIQAMSIVQATDKCVDCTHCKKWSSDNKEASGDMNKRSQGFHPDQNVPTECLDKMTRAY